MTKKNAPKTIEYAKLTLEEGLAFIASEETHINGMPTSRPSGRKLFLAMPEKLACVECGIEANAWVSERSKAQMKQDPVLNLFHIDDKGGKTMITRDHIIPRSLGGSDAVENLRVMCHCCNRKRAIKFDESDSQFLVGNFETLFLKERFDATFNRIKNMTTCGHYGDFKSCIDMANVIQWFFKTLSDNGKLTEDLKVYESELPAIKELLVEKRKLQKQHQEEVKLAKEQAALAALG